MKSNAIGHSTPQETGYNINKWIAGFIVDRQAQNLAQGTISFYETKLKTFTKFTHERQINYIGELTPGILREYLLNLESYKASTVLACYRAIKAFLYWFWEEVEPDFANPIRKVKSPKVPDFILEPVEVEDVKKLVAVCKSRRFVDVRDKAIFLTLLDAGLRASELLNLDLEDVDLITGQVFVKTGKGRKSRMVFLGKVSRKAMRRYLAKRSDTIPALFVTRDLTRMTYGGLRSLVKRRAKKAGLEKAPTLHSFRRAFAINSLRNGLDLMSLSRLLGHSDLDIVRQYLKLSNGDLEEAHRRTGPVDNML